MYCDYVALSNETNNLVQILNSITEIFSSLEESFKKIYGISNWNSEARNYFYNELKQVFINMDNINQKFYNIKEYLETIIINYSNVDKNLGNLFSL